MMNKKFNRRDFLKAAALSAGAALLAACTPAASVTTTTPTSEATTASAAMPAVTDTAAVAIPAATATTAAAAATDTPAPTATAAAAGGSASTLPRNETLYFNGQQWGSVVGWNPYSSSNNNAMAVAAGDSARVTMFETPYLYDMLDGKQYPLLADGDFTWDTARTSITFKLKAATKWSDGTAVTADDVAYTWATHVKYNTATGAANKDYIDTITASDPQTVVIKGKPAANGKVTPLLVGAYVSGNYVMQKAWTQKLEARVSTDATKLMADPAEDVVYSGPYHKFFVDDTKVVLVRDDNYWGKDAAMWAKLPVPKYLAHVIYKDNAAGTTALQAGEVDVSQEFNSNVQDLWLKQKLPISTYLPDAPYGIGAGLPTAGCSMASYRLD